jgi:hypothetical protein
MSGVLDRLAKLAMGALPTVQPLTAPRYASRSSELHPIASEPEASLEIEAPAPPPRTTSRSSRPMEPEASGKTSNQLDPPTVRTEMRTTDIALQTESISADEAIKRVPPITSRFEAPSGFRNHAARESEPLQSNRAQRQPDEPAQPIPRNDRTAAAAPETISRATSAFTPQEPAIPERPSPTAEITSDAQPASQTSPKRSIQVIESKLGAHRDSAKRPGPPAAPPEQRTEIHISIGSIELRAPRSETKPPVPQFRPRVSLDDFLRRKSEAGA